MILNKTQGKLTHGGGEQVPADSDDFHNMERFLAMLEDEVAAEPDDHGGGQPRRRLIAASGYATNVMYGSNDCAKDINPVKIGTPSRPATIRASSANTP